MAVLALTLGTAASLAAADAPRTKAAKPSAPTVSGTLEGNILVGGSGHVFLIDAKGQIVWEQPANLVHDAWMLPSGNVLYADGNSVSEVTPDHRVVFSYKATEQHGGGTYACQRLENGKTLIGENSTGRVLEVDSAGKIVFELQTSPYSKGNHHNMRMVRKLDNGNYLVCHSGSHMVKEYTPAGKVVLEIKTPNVAFAAIRTAKNTTLVAALDHIFEYDAAGKVVWQFANNDIPGVTITNMTGMQLLPSGNLAVGCYSAYKGNEGTGLFEITRDKKLVWSYANPASRDRSMMAIERLGADRKALPGKTSR
jgi:hypothetical protein